MTIAFGWGVLVCLLAGQEVEERVVFTFRSASDAMYSHRVTVDVKAPGRPLVAFVLPETVAGKSRLFINGKPGKVYDGIDRVTVNAQGTQIAYRAAESGQWRMVVGESEGPLFRSIPEIDGGPIFDSAGKSVAYAAPSEKKVVIGDEVIPVRNVKTLKDRFWFEREGVPPGSFEVVDPRDGHRRISLPGRRWDELVFESGLLPDGTLRAYRVGNKRQAYQAAGAAMGPEFDRVWGLSVSPDGKRFAYYAQDGGRVVVVENHRPLTEFQEPKAALFPYQILVPAGEEALIYTAVEGGGPVIKRGTQRVAEGGRGPQNPRLSPDGVTLTYEIRNSAGQDRTAVVGDHRIPDAETPVVFSADGHRFAVVQTLKDTGGFPCGQGINANGNLILTLPGFPDAGKMVSDPEFDADGGRLSFAAIRGKELIWMTVSVPIPPGVVRDAPAENITPSPQTPASRSK